MGLRTLCFTLGCTQVAAVTAAFLLQATNIITPCLAFLAGDQVSHRVWLGTVVVTSGTVLIFFDRLGEVDKQEAPDAGWLQTLGMAAVLAAAFFNSLRTVRVSQLAPGALCHRMMLASTESRLSITSRDSKSINTALSSQGILLSWPDISPAVDMTSDFFFFSRLLERARDRLDESCPGRWPKQA